MSSSNPTSCGNCGNPNCQVMITSNTLKDKTADEVYNMFLGAPHLNHVAKSKAAKSAYLHFLAHRSAFSFASRCNTHPVVVDGEVCTIRGPTANLYRLQRFPYSAEKRKRESVEEAESAELGLLLCKAELYENAEAIKDTYS